MATIIPDPKDLTWPQWSQTVVGFNPTFGQYLHPSMDWRLFASQLTYLAPQTPRPQQYATWQLWAQATRQVLAS